MMRHGAGGVLSSRGAAAFVLMVYFHVCVFLRRSAGYESGCAAIHWHFVSCRVHHDSALAFQVLPCIGSPCAVAGMSMTSTPRFSVLDVLNREALPCANRTDTEVQGGELDEQSRCGQSCMNHAGCGKSNSRSDFVEDGLSPSSITMHVALIARAELMGNRRRLVALPSSRRLPPSA